MKRLPPMPWARWEDGEPIGWSLARSLWKSYLLPYRTAEYRGYDEETGELVLGPWHWNRPDVLNRPRVRSEAEAR